MTDNEIIKALECCSNEKCAGEKCPLHERTVCTKECLTMISGYALDLIQRQQKQFETLKKAFRAEFEEKMELGIEDCINWADWLDSIASEMWKEVKCNDR